MINFNSYYSKMLMLIFILIIIPTSAFAFNNESVIIQESVGDVAQSEIYVSTTGDDNNDGTINSPKLTLDGENGAIAYASSKNISNIIIDNGLYQVDGMEINSQNFNLNSLVIKGSTSTVISAVNSNIFSLTSQYNSQKSVNITFSNIDFINSNYYLPAIANFHSYLTIINCNFYNNAGSSSSVLGCYSNSTTKIFNSKFYNNKDKSSTGVIESSTGVIGSSLPDDENRMTNNILIENCQFYENMASSGGVISNIADASIDISMTIKNSNFTDNEAKEDGGAIYTLSMTITNHIGSTNLNIDNCIFKDNIAGGCGGAICARGNSILNLNNSKFINNKASFDLSISNDGAGGAIFEGEGSSRIYNCDFSLNSASRGGAIFNTISEDIILINSTFTQNKATIGGGVYMDLFRDYGQYSLFENITFNSNIAEVGASLFSNDLNIDNNLPKFFNCINSKFINNPVFNVGNLGLYNDIFTNSDIYNTGTVLTNNNIYTNSIIKNNTKQAKLTFLANLSGYYGDTVKVQAKASDLFSNDFIIFKIGLDEYVANFNQSSGLYEYNYKIYNQNNGTVTGYSLLDNNLISNEVYISVLKLPVNLTISINNMYLNNPLNISVRLNSNNTLLSANIVVIIGNKQFNVFVKNGYGNAVFNNVFLKVGEYIATASYGKNNVKYQYTISNTSFLVFPRDVSIINSLNGAVINIASSSVYYASKVTLIANLYKNGQPAFYTGQFNFKINNDIITATYDVSTYQYKAEYTFLQTENQVITISTTDSPIINEGILTFIKNPTKLTLSMPNTIFDDSILNVHITLTSNNEYISGVVSLKIHNQTYEINVVRGFASIQIQNLPVGDFTAFAKFNENNYYYGTNCSYNFKVILNLKRTSIIAHNIELYYGNGTRFYATLVDCYNNPIANEEIIFYINGVKNKRITNSEGKASIAINLSPKFYIVTTEFNGNLNYNPTNTYNTVNVMSTILGDNITKIFRNSTQYYAKFLDKQGNFLTGIKVSFNINGVFYERTTDVGGVARMNINLAPGEYTITAMNPITQQSYSNLITVLSSIDGDDLVKFFRNASQYKAIFYDSDGSPLVGVKVSFNINGVFYERTTDVGGVARMNINLAPGEYIITAMNPINNQLYSNQVTVLSVLIGEDLILNYHDGSKYIIKAIEGNGNPAINVPLKLNINGVFYNRTTDWKGFAALTINLMPGVYIITTYWASAINSNTVTVL